MTKIIILSLMLFTSTALWAEDLSCTVSVNLQLVAKAEVSVQANTKEMYVEAQDYVFYVRNKGNSKFELEILDIGTPSRSYAEGVLKTADDQLAWTLWSRDILLETSCKLAGEK